MKGKESEVWGRGLKRSVPFIFILQSEREKGQEREIKKVRMITHT